MTAGQFGAVDLDRLADYVGGALTGPDEAAVDRLVRDDPAWSAAYAQLAPAVDAVRGHLAAWGSEPVTMPPDLADRLTDLLADARGTESAGPAVPAAAGRPARSPAPAQHRPDSPHRSNPKPPADRPTAPTGPNAGRPDSNRPDSNRPDSNRPDSNRPDAGGRGRRRRWSRTLGPLAVAAAAVVIAGLGINQAIGRNGADSASTGSADRPAAGPAEAVLGPGARRPTASGLDYDAATLASAASTDVGTTAGAGRPGATGDSAGLAPDGRSATGRTSVAPGLDRLADPAELKNCLDAVAVAHAAGTITVGSVDYAAYAGSPALVVVFTDPASARWAWAVGPDCGLPASGADSRAQARVG